MKQNQRSDTREGSQPSPSITSATPMNMKENIESVKCPKCGTKLFSVFVEWLSKISGLSLHELENGALQELGWRMKISEKVMTISGIKITEEQITEKTAEKTLKYVEKIFTEKILEKEREKYEQQIEDLKRLMEERMKSKDEIIRELEKSRRDLKEKEIENLQEKIKLLEEQKFHRENDYENLKIRYTELEGKVKHIPTIVGKEKEEEVLKRLEAVCQDVKDRFDLEKSSSLGEDLFSSVIDNNQEMGKIVIEVKKTERWLNDYLNQTRCYMRKHATNWAILATKTMPANALNNALYITHDNVWIVREDLLEFGYRAMREIIVSMYREKLSESQVKEAINLFREKILSDKFQARFINIITNADKVEEITNQLQKSTEKRCKSLRVLSKEIRNEISHLMDEIKEIVQEVKTMKI